MTTIPEIEKHAKESMRKAVESTRHELSGIRSGKASPALMDVVRVEAYGAMVPLTQVAMVSAPEARLITVQPFDKGLTQAIEKAIRDSDLGVNPAAQGGIIRVPLPALTEERRKELVKVVHKLAEEGRVAVRHARGDAMTKVKKLSGLPVDDVKRAEKEIQKVTDEHIKQIDTLIHTKEQELLAI